MRIRSAAALCLGVLIGCAALSAQTYPLNQQAPSAGTATFPGFDVARGWRFTVSVGGVMVSQLGCNTPDSATVARTVTLWDHATRTVLARATPTAGPGWRWANLATPVALQMGTEYCVSVYANCLYGWHGTAPASWMPTGTVNYLSGQWRNLVTHIDDYPWTSAAANNQGHADFGYTTGPQLSVSALTGQAVNAYANETGPGGNGIRAGTFTIAANSLSGAALNEIKLRAAGTGDDSAAFSHVAVHRDTNDDNVFDPVADALIGTSATAFPADNGLLTFIAQMTEQVFNTSESRRFFVVVKLAGVAQPGQTFNFIVEDITVAGGAKGGVPSATINGVVIAAPEFAITDVSPPAPAMAFLGSSGNLCQAFTVAYPNGPDDKPLDLTITGLGTGDEAAHLTAVELWHDADNSGDISAADVLVDSGAYTADNGTVTFSMASHAVFQAGQTRHFFVVYALGTTAPDQATFQCYVSAATGGPGVLFNGLPAPGLSGAPGLVVSANLLMATLHGPTTPAVVDNTYTGPSGDGALLCDVTLAAAPGGNWTVSSLTFQATGTAAINAAFSEVALYEDTGNGVWEGAATDGLASSLQGGFSLGSATFALSGTGIGAGTSRRFFLVGKLNGTATAGQTFQARLSAVAATPPPGGQVLGVPTADSSALVIDAAALTVVAGPGQPAPVTHVAGTAAEYTVLQLRLYASNSAVTVQGMDLTATGSGDWANEVSGVQVHVDDGDGVFVATLDTQIYSGPGGAVIGANFAVPVVVANAGHADLWVRIGLNATAGIGAAAAPRTFLLAVAGPTDVSTVGGVAVVLGTPAPVGATLGAIEFFVSGFTPTADQAAGGAPITIAGSGLMAPLVVRIGGVICPGTPVISGGTQVTGLTVPTGTGQNLPITIASGNLPTHTLTQTFTYSNVGSASNGGSGGGGGGCAAGVGTGWLAALALLALARMRRRRADG